MTPYIPNRFYVHNGFARASLAIQHDPTTGIVLLATSFATTKPDGRTGRIDIYSKKAARALIDSRFDDYLGIAVKSRSFPPLMLTPGVVFVGIYDGDKTKNDIFGPLIDIFNELGPKRNVDEANCLIHGGASSLLIFANHRIANANRKTLKSEFAARRLIWNSL